MMNLSGRLSHLYKALSASILARGYAKLSYEVIMDTFGGRLHHHPMYFPMPGMPDCGDPMKDFHEWLKVQSMEATEILTEYGYWVVRPKPEVGK